jgi:hypothetical protein
MGAWNQFSAPFSHGLSFTGSTSDCRRMHWHPPNLIHNRLKEEHNFSIIHTIRKSQENHRGLKMNRLHRVFENADDINLLNESINSIK